MNREKAIHSINELPLEFEVDELIEKLIFIEKVKSGLKQLNEGKTTPHAVVKEMVKKW